MPRAPGSIRFRKVSLCFLGAVAWLPLGGCYDGRELVQRAAQRVADDDLTEIDLGAYQVTLPRCDAGSATTLALEIVATVQRRHAAKFERELSEAGALLRHATLLALRQCQKAELLEPTLQGLKDRIQAAATQQLHAAPIMSIAVRSFTVHEE
jgi:hypothetical protein